MFFGSWTPPLDILVPWVLPPLLKSLCVFEDVAGQMAKSASYELAAGSQRTLEDFVQAEVLVSALSVSGALTFSSAVVLHVFIYLYVMLTLLQYEWHESKGSQYSQGRSKES